MTERYRVYQVTFEIAAQSHAEACVHARDLVASGVAFTVRAGRAPAPSARAVLASGAMNWVVRVPATTEGEPCELMVAFDGARRRACLVVMAGDPNDAQVGSPVYLSPQAASDLRDAIELWPEDIIARMVTEDVLCGCAPRTADAARGGASDE